MAISQSFLLGRFPQGFVFPPTASRQCAATPTERKYTTQIATSLSNSKYPDREPHAAKDVTIQVYGKNKIPILILKFLEPNFGTNHSESLSVCTIIYGNCCLYDIHFCKLRKICYLMTKNESNYETLSKIYQKRS